MMLDVNTLFTVTIMVMALLGLLLILVWLQNRGASFRLDPKHPNAIAPRKRPMHTIMPAMAMRGGKVLMPFGVMGGDYQAIGQAQLMISLLDYGMDLQEAIDLPRVFHFKGFTEVERSVPARSSQAGALASSAQSVAACAKKRIGVNHFSMGVTTR